MKRIPKVSDNQLSIFDALNRQSYERTSYIGNSHSVIYFIYAPAVNRVKIGITKAGKALGRLSGLQVGSPVTLTLVGTIPGDMWLESKYQNMFHLSHHHGEWYDLTPPLKSFIDNLLPKANWELFPDSSRRRDGQAYLKSLNHDEIELIECQLRGLPPIRLASAA